MKYILIETEYDVICRTEVFDTIEEAQAELKKWCKIIADAIPNASIWENDEHTYAHARTKPFYLGPWAQIVKTEKC